jgi:hypothetical protein
MSDKMRESFEEECHAEEALRSLACWLGVGGYNADKVDAEAFERRIREGVEMLVSSEVRRHIGAGVALMEGPKHGIRVTPDGIRAVALPPGFVAVPVEPTPKMQAEAWAGIEAAGCLGMNYNEAARKVWAAMLAARPEVKL